MTWARAPDIVRAERSWRLDHQVIVAVERSVGGVNRGAGGAAIGKGVRVGDGMRGSILIVNDGRGEGADGLDPIRHPIDPSAAVRGRFDATALLVLWLVRSSVPALFLAGVSYAWVVSEKRLAAMPQVTSPGQAIQLLLSPFAVVAIAIFLRFLVGIAALILAYPLSRRETGSSMGPGSWRPFPVWTDRLHLVRAYRSLRWTSTVRQTAATRLGRWGRVLSWSGPAFLIAAVVMFIALFVVVYLNPRS